MTTENKRMSQLIGSYADLDLSQLLNGEIALPTDHNPVYKDADGNVKELLSGESAGYLEDLIEEMNEGLAEIQQIIIQRIGINDEEVSLLETFSSSKITDLLADKQDTLTAGTNVQISSGNVISATDTTYTAGSNVQISANNEISATDTTYSAGTNITISANNEINCNVLDDTAASTTTTYSSTKIQQVIADVGGVAIDDTTASTTTVYSSSKTESLINTSLTQLLDRFYPVGCVVMSFNDMTDAEVIQRYGGTTWERIRERYLIAAGNSSHIVGTTGGSSTVTLTTNNLPSHSHTYLRSSTSTGSTTLTTNQIPSHSHTQAYDSSGGWLPARNIPTSISNDSDTGEFSNVSGNYYNVGLIGDTGGSGSHYHSITRTSVASDSTGSGTAFSIEPPYIAIYMWRRTA